MMRATVFLVCLGLVASPALGQDPPAPQSAPTQSAAPQSTEPQSIGPQSIGPQSIVPQSAGPQTAEPQTAEPQNPTSQSVPQVPASPPVEAPAPVSAPVPEPAPSPVPAPDPVPKAIDPLGDLIDQSTPQTTDEEEAPAATPLPHHKPTLLPIPPPEPPTPAPGATLPQGASLPAEQVYELRVKGSIAAAQGLQGPLDGGWLVRSVDGATLYALQLVDPASGNGPLEGAWRDVRRPASVGSTGLVETVERLGERLIIRFSPRVGQSAELSLNPLDDMRWQGSLSEDGADRAVVAEQQAPPSLPPGYVVRSRGPVIWPPRAAAPSRPAVKPICSTRGKTGKALKAAKARCAALAKKSGGKGKAVAKGKKGSKAKATAPRKKAAVKKKS